MSIHVRQLEQYFENTIVGLLNTNDLSKRNPDDKKNICLSRALTAFSITSLSGSSLFDVADFVFDGERDQGIDGLYYDSIKNRLIFVQSKWSNNGKKTIGKGDLLKFLHGVKRVFIGDWSSFSEKFNSKKSIIDEVLLKPDLSVIVAVAFTGDNKLGEECSEVLKQFEQEQNLSGDFLETKILDLKTLHRHFRTATLSTQQPFTAMILDWGQVQNPHHAVYGRICCEDLAKLYGDSGDALFEPNIRSFLGDGDVNGQIIGTLKNRPDDFWYLNNGVTGICTKYHKTALGGGDNRQAGTFVFEGLQIVNGAQTIGSIAKAYEKSPEEVSKAFVMFKVVSLDGTPLDYAETITTSTNRQNKVEEKDFLSLDPNQNRIKMELNAEKIQYVFRSGEKVENYEVGFDVTESMIALACASKDVGDAVLAKRNIGLLLDKKSGAYQKLFNSNLKGDEIWGLVQNLRSIDSAMASLQKNSTDSRKKQILTHGSRVIAWAIFNSFEKIDFSNSLNIKEAVIKISNEIDVFLKNNYPDSYLAVFFKNSKKCQELASNLFNK